MFQDGNLPLQPIAAEPRLFPGPHSSHSFRAIVSATELRPTMANVLNLVRYYDIFETYA